MVYCLYSGSNVIVLILVITGVEDVRVLVLHQRPLLLRAELRAAGHRGEGRRVVLERGGRVLGVVVAWRCVVREVVALVQVHRGAGQPPRGRGRAVGGHRAEGRHTVVGAGGVLVGAGGPGAAVQLLAVVQLLVTRGPAGPSWGVLHAVVDLLVPSCSCSWVELVHLRVDLLVLQGRRGVPRLAATRLHRVLGSWLDVGAAAAAPCSTWPLRRP